jgi:hypothetical protein
VEQVYALRKSKLGDSEPTGYTCRMPSDNRIAKIRIELDGTSVWRRVEVPLTLSLKGLHDVMQAVMGFEDYHLFQFAIADRRYGIPSPEWETVRDAKNLKLAVLIERGVTEFLYTYDLGDNWQHTITVQAIGDAAPGHVYPRFLDGAGHAPPEDVGGVPGFEEFLEAIADPSHDDHDRMLEWYGRSFDVDEIEPETIRARLTKLAHRRSQGRAR